MKNTDKYNNLVQSIKDDEEKEKEQNRFDATLEQIKEALILLQKLLEAIKEAKESSVTTHRHREEQRGRMDFHKTVLHCRLSFPTVNHNDCHRDSFLCVLQVDSMITN